MAVTKLIEGNQRSIIGEYEFDVAPEALWAALTDPHEIEKWFCLHARVEGKVGGEIEFNWDPLFDFKWIDHITVWEDKRRIAFTPRPQDLEANNSPYVCEFVITTDKGKTKLKMVHSGFNHGANWDDEYDSIFGGWTYELFSLWYYMTHHRGSKRDLYWARVNIADLQEKNPFQAITDLQGFFEGKSIRDLKVGDRYKVRLSDNDVLEGIVMQCRPDDMDQFAGTVENLNNGLFRIGSGMKFCFGWLALYGIESARTAHLETLLRNKFNTAFALSA